MGIEPRTYICEGPINYELESLGPNQARREASRKFKEETNSTVPLGMLFLLYRSNLKESRKPGRKHSMDIVDFTMEMKKDV
jgi:hypothetical protein